MPPRKTLRPTPEGRLPPLQAVRRVSRCRTHSIDPRSGVVRRLHLHDQTFQCAFKRALIALGPPHPWRHSGELPAQGSPAGPHRTEQLHRRFDPRCQQPHHDDLGMG